MLGKFSFTNKIVAKNLSLQETQVKSVMDFYIRELEQEITSCKHPFVFVKGLGTFGLNQLIIDKKLRNMISGLRGHMRNRYNGLYLRREEMIKIIRTEIYNLFAVRKVIKKQRKENYAKINARKSLYYPKG